MSEKHWTSNDIDDQTGRVAIVTGANSGIGYETARALAHKGATVVLACRNPEKAEAARDRLLAESPRGQVEFVPLDLSALDSVQAFAETFTSRHQRLDLLVANAGVMMPPTRSQTGDGFELQMGTNHLGHFALVGRLLPRLINTPGSRVVVVSSLAHRNRRVDFDDLHWENRRYSRWKSYGQSKLANLLFTYELQRRLQEAGMETIATAAHPGWTSTNLQKDSALLRLFNPIFGMKPEQGALPSLYAATAADVAGGGYYGPHGFFEMKGYPRKVASSPASHDRDSAARLWQLSEQLTEVRFDALERSAPTESN